MVVLKSLVALLFIPTISMADEVDPDSAEQMVEMGDQLSGYIDPGYETAAHCFDNSERIIRIAVNAADFANSPNTVIWEGSDADPELYLHKIEEKGDKLVFVFRHPEGANGFTNFSLNPKAGYAETRMHFAFRFSPTMSCNSDAAIVTSETTERLEGGEEILEALEGDIEWSRGMNQWTYPFAD